MINFLQRIRDYPRVEKELNETLGNLFDAKEKLSISLKANEILERELKRKKEDESLANYWNNKYPFAKITYKCRPHPKNSKEKLSVPVNVFLTPYDPFILADLREWSLLGTKEEPETLVPKIYKKLYSTYKYKLDKDNFGIDEFWLFPFESRSIGAFDCEDAAHIQASYYLAAGVPEWQVRCVAGDSSLGGHASVYVFSKKSAKWRHINATYGGLLGNELSSYPTHADAESGKDKIGIKRVWFSYTLSSGFATFEADEEEKKIKGFLIKKG